MRKLLLLALVTAAVVTTSVIGATAATVRGSRRPRRHGRLCSPRWDGAALRPRVRLRLGRAWGGGVPQVGERKGRRRRAHHRVQVPRRRVQPGPDRPGHPPARRAGQGLRRLQHARDRAQRGDPRLPERRRRCRSSSPPRARRRSAPTSRSTRTPSASSRATRPRAGSTASSSRARPRAARLPCSSRTTRTARISSSA